MTDWTDWLGGFVGCVMAFLMARYVLRLFDPKPVSTPMEAEVKVPEERPAPKMSDFRGMYWSWAVSDTKKTSEGGGMPKGDVLTKVLLQEMRDDAKIQRGEILLLLEQQNEQLEKLNAYLRQMFGNPEGSA